MADGHPARELWTCFEPIHAVVYFAPEVASAYRAAGLRGFWMGYFAGRSAAFGEASAELVTSTFFNFHPSMPARALPDAWSFASPAAVLAARLDGAGAALRGILGAERSESTEVARIADIALDAAHAAPSGGRPLFAAHLSLDVPAPGLLRLWHAVTLLREHRGDGHVAALVAEGLDGLEAHVLLVATGAVPKERMLAARGWSDVDWDGAVARLTERGLLDRGGAISRAGRELHTSIEATTDRLAWEPWVRLGEQRTARVREVLAGLADAVLGSGVVPFPNPMGLPPRRRSSSDR